MSPVGCQRLAVEKAKWSPKHPGARVIGSDQVADLDGVRLGETAPIGERSIEQFAMQVTRSLSTASP